jgi:hypothetical protein
MGEREVKCGKVSLELPPFTPVKERWSNCPQLAPAALPGLFWLEWGWSCPLEVGGQRLI